MNCCNKCLENNWEYEFNDGMIEATCQNCGNEIEFEAKGKKKRKINDVGDLCRRCNNPVIFRESKFHKKKLLKKYYYTGYYWCPKCKEMYMSEKFKVYNK